MFGHRFCVQSRESLMEATPAPLLCQRNREEWSGVVLGCAFSPRNAAETREWESPKR